MPLAVHAPAKVITDLEVTLALSPELWAGLFGKVNDSVGRPSSVPEQGLSVASLLYFAAVRAASGWRDI